ncbi:MAG: hypothetical protein ACK5PD_12840 [Pirellulaceae bacterium]|jgi:hypothetical protein
MFDDILDNPWRMGALLIGAYWAWRNILGSGNQPQPQPPAPQPPPEPSPSASVSRSQAMQAADVLASYLAQAGSESGKADLAKVVNAIWGK